MGWRRPAPRRWTPRSKPPTGACASIPSGSAPSRRVQPTLAASAAAGGFGRGGGFGGGRGGFRRGIDEATLKQIAAMTDGTYYAASSASELLKVFQNLPTYLITKHEVMEISVVFAAVGALLVAAGPRPRPALEPPALIHRVRPGPSPRQQ